MHVRSRPGEPQVNPRTRPRISCSPRLAVPFAVAEQLRAGVRGRAGAAALPGLRAGRGVLAVAAGGVRADRVPGVDVDVGHVPDEVVAAVARVGGRVGVWVYVCVGGLRLHEWAGGAALDHHSAELDSS